jgi:hypothetical protein
VSLARTHDDRTLHAGTGSGGGRIDVKRLIVLCPIKNKREVRLDGNKMHIFGARRINARNPCAEELASPKSVESGNLGLTKAVIRCRCTEELPGVLDARRNLPRAKEGRVAASKSPFAAQTKAQDRRCAKKQSTAFGRRS